MHYPAAGVALGRALDRLEGTRAPSRPATRQPTPGPLLRSWVYESTAPAFTWVYVVGYSTLAPPPLAYPLACM